MPQCQWIMMTQAKSSPIPADLQGATSHDTFLKQMYTRYMVMRLSHKEIERDRLIIIILRCNEIEEKNEDAPE